MKNQWQQGNIIQLEITDLSNNGDGISRLDGRVVFVPNTVTGDLITARLVRVKSQYGYGKLEQIIEPSPHRIRPRCLVADKCGGCQWQHIDDSFQLLTKQDQVLQTLQRIGGFENIKIEPILASKETLGYRNKATYPLVRSTTGIVQAGYYRQGSHQLINLNQCPVQDHRLNPFLAEIKQDIQTRGWSIYNESKHQGKLRHLSLRIGRNTGEVLLTLVSTAWQLPELEEQTQQWLNKYPQLVGVILNYNPDQTNVIFGRKSRFIAGNSYLEENFGGLKFQLASDTFFQVNTEGAELLLNNILAVLNLQGNEILLDAYCGIGTFTLPLAQKVKQAYGIEIQAVSIEQANINAKINQIDNVIFYQGKVEKILTEIDFIPDLVLLDPPRKGCDRRVIESLLTLKPPTIIYISCQPATLARDLKLLCQTQDYQLKLIQPIDFFPQTSHVEVVAFLEKQHH
jgi:23S rRNA (uracil1939-C5)-methyltransferase